MSMVAATCSFPQSLCRLCINCTDSFFLASSSLGSLALSRPVTCSLSKTSGGRVFSLDYRLAPQHPFPAALYDLLTAYLSLIHPSPGLGHTARPASKIVLAGDSTGGALTLSLIQLLLHFSRQGLTSLPFNDEYVSLALPAGTAVLSAYLGRTDSLPSYLSTRDVDYSGQPPIYNAPNYPSCPIWPSRPPRAVAYCAGSMLCHPLVSPASAPSWAGAPPMFFAVGEESVRDGCQSVAQRAAAQGVKIVWEQYSGMPHIFVMLPGVGGLPQVEACLREWGGFCALVGKGEKVKRSWKRINLQGVVEDEQDMKWMTGLELDKVRAKMRRGMQEIEEAFQKRLKSQSKM